MRTWGPDDSSGDSKKVILSVSDRGGECISPREVASLLHHGQG